MHRGRDTSFTFALCASLVVHAALSLALAEMYVRDADGRIWLAAPGRDAPAEARVLPPLDAVDPRPWPLGDSSGTGYAIDPAPGEKQLLARRGVQDQPFLSRDPVGYGRVGDEPTQWTLPPGSGASAPPRLPPPTFASTGERPVVGLAVLKAEARIGPGPTAQVRSVDRSAQPAQPSVPPGAAGTRHAGSDSSADPAPKGESELDPVAIVGTMDWRSGATQVRAGRKHKLIRPRLSVDASLDLVALGPTRLVLLIHLDRGGRVSSSHVVHSSGSASVDQIFKVISYEWWFEPATDPAGEAVDDVFQFIIRIN